MQNRDQQFEKWKRVFLDGQEHQEPAIKTIQFMEKTSIDICYVKKEMTEIKQTLHEFIDRCDKDYVSKDRFKPVELITYGLVSLIGGGFVAGLFYLLLH